MYLIYFLGPRSIVLFHPRASEDVRSSCLVVWVVVGHDLQEKSYMYLFPQLIVLYYVRRYIVSDIIPTSLTVYIYTFVCGGRGVGCYNSTSAPSPNFTVQFKLCYILWFTLHGIHIKWIYSYDYKFSLMASVYLRSFYTIRCLRMITRVYSILFFEE